MPPLESLVRDPHHSSSYTQIRIMTASQADLNLSIVLLGQKFVIEK